MKKKDVHVSVVSALLNEKDHLEILHSKVRESLTAAGYGNFEIIFVDDGSTDGSRKIIRKLCRKNSRTRAVIFDRNYGKTAAIEAGVNIAKGNVVVTIDSDLQHDPEEIQLLVDQIIKGYDVVTGKRVERKDAFHRMIFSKVVNYSVYLFTGYKTEDFYCGFKCFKKEMVDDLGIFSDLYRFIAYMARQKDLKVIEIPITSLPRKFGASKYRIRLITRAIKDLLIILFVVRYLKKKNFKIKESF
jgi:glycosyltransferase involved in cell wall biosynthesis